MTQDEIIEMALKAGLAFDSDEFPEIWQVYMDAGKEEIEAFAHLIAAHEREECAKVCESRLERWLKNIGKDKMYKWMQGLPDLIRARGQT